MPQWYAELADAIEAVEQAHLECSSCGAAMVPPRSLCSECGAASLTDRPLSKTATVGSYTERHVTTPKFHGTTPYTVVVAAFDECVQLTGQLRGSESVAIGDTVGLGTEKRDGERTVLTFTPESTDG